MEPLKQLVANNIGEAKSRIASMAFVGEDKIQGEMEAINKHALKPLTAEEVFIFQFELSNSNVDYYATRMTLGTLNNYAAKINSQGVPLEGHHDDYRYPLGRIYKAEVVKSDDGVNRMSCRAYILRGDENTGDISSDAVIRKIEGGVQKDVSIGFLAGGYTCSVCGEPMVSGFFGRVMGLECEHIPGASYEGQMCYAWVEDGEILEGSLVSTGATPQAIIQKAINFVQAGKLTAKMVNGINRALNTTLAVDKQEGEQDMKAKELLQEVAKSGRISADMKQRIETRSNELKDDAPVEEGAAILTEEIGKVEAEKADLQTKVDELQPQADEAATEKTAAGNEMDAEGVRAMGDKYPKESMETFKRSATIKDIKAMTENYRNMVDVGAVNNGQGDNPVDVNGEDADETKEVVSAENFQ